MCEILFVIQLEPVHQVLPFDWLTTDHLVSGESTLHWVTLGAIHSTKIPTGPTRKREPPQKVDPFFRNFSGWTEPIHWVLDRNFRKVWLNGSRPLFSARSRIFLPIAQSYAALFCCRLAIRASSLGWLVGNKTALIRSAVSPLLENVIIHYL